jgi:hypothetical protein
MSIALELGGMPRAASVGVSTISMSLTPLAYTNDIVRLAASLKIVIDAGSLSIRFKSPQASMQSGRQWGLWG